MSLSLRLIVNVSCRNLLLNILLKYRVEAVDLSQLGVFSEVAPIILISWIIFNIRPNSNRAFHLKDDNNDRSNKNNND